MSDTHAEPNYISIFWWLLALTILEIAVIYPPFASIFIIILLVCFALAKASLVAMYFMHLKFERFTLAMIAVTPIIICLFLILMLLPDMA